MLHPVDHTPHVATVSAGVDLDAESLLELADKALYAAKQSGRKQVRVTDAVTETMETV
jgi:PleD family two-component response regulator